MKLEPKPEDTKAINAAITAAIEKWMGTFSEIPRRIIAKLYMAGDPIMEVTPTEGEDFDDILPIWGTMWAFTRHIDNIWLQEEGLEAMAKCGFRIFEQEDYGYIFGIEGAGYDFYEAHWVPLYKARRLKWHLN